VLYLGKAGAYSSEALTRLNFMGKLLEKMRPKWKWQTMANTLASYDMEFFSALKIFKRMIELL
jgi:hypothetical protein